MDQLGKLLHPPGQREGREGVAKKFPLKNLLSPTLKKYVRFPLYNETLTPRKLDKLIGLNLSINAS